MFTMAADTLPIHNAMQYNAMWSGTPTQPFYSSSLAPLEFLALIPPEDAFAHLPHLPPQLPLLLPGDPGAGGVLQPLAKENLD